MVPSECDVLVVGAGPVGLSLTMDLAARGVKVVVVELRGYAEPPSVKCNHVSARTMERFRRLGIALFALEIERRVEVGLHRLGQDRRRYHQRRPDQS